MNNSVKIHNIKRWIRNKLSEIRLRKSLADFINKYGMRHFEDYLIEQGAVCTRSRSQRVYKITAHEHIPTYKVIICDCINGDFDINVIV